MSKLTEYSAATGFDSGDIIIKDGTNGTKKMTAANAAIGFAGLVSTENRRNTYRGKSLGSTVSAEHRAAIKAGTFADLFIGDYWTIDGVNYRIADMDYWYNTGDTAFTSHHLVIVPDTSLYSAEMNDENTTEGGYVGSKMYTTNLEQAKQKIKAAFGDMLLSHKEYLINAVTDGHGSGGAWFDSEVELMNEIMVYGCHIRAAMNMGSPVASTYTVEKQQLALFQLNPKMINRRFTYWLRDVVSATNFAAVGNYGSADNRGASSSYGVRPVFAIG